MTVKEVWQDPEVAFHSAHGEKGGVHNRWSCIGQNKLGLLHTIFPSLNEEAISKAMPANVDTFPCDSASRQVCSHRCFLIIYPLLEGF